MVLVLSLAAAAALAGPSGAGGGLLEGSRLAIGLQPFAGGETAAPRHCKDELPRFIAEGGIGGGLLNQNIRQAIDAAEQHRNRDDGKSGEPDLPAAARHSSAAPSARAMAAGCCGIIR